MTNLKSKEKTAKEPLIHIVKNDNLPKWKAWVVRIIALVVALLISGIVSAILTKGSPFTYFGSLFVGTFGTPRRIWNLLQNTAILLCVSLAVTPAFKMRFWNIGAEGQVLMGALACAACMLKLGGKINEGVLILIMAIASVGVGAIWAGIPAIFKAIWNTNETLFTLMMNYVAVCLVNYFIKVWIPSGSGVIGILTYGHLPIIGNFAYLLNIIIVTVVTVIVAIYLVKSKHGYEISVVGESENTARYIGVNVKKVIVRTMLLSGAICGIASFLLVAGTHHTVTPDIVGGRGFTAIMVSWLAKFNPIYMVATSFFVVFLQQGSKQAATTFMLGESFSEIVTGIFFFFIIGCEFFINYKIKLSHSMEEKLKRVFRAAPKEVK